MHMDHNFFAVVWPNSIIIKDDCKYNGCFSACAGILHLIPSFILGFKECLKEFTATSKVAVKQIIILPHWPEQSLH